MKNGIRYTDGMALLLLLVAGGGLTAWILRKRKQENRHQDVGRWMTDYSG